MIPTYIAAKRYNSQSFNICNFILVKSWTMNEYMNGILIKDAAFLSVKFKQSLGDTNEVP